MTLAGEGSGIGEGDRIDGIGIVVEQHWVAYEVYLLSNLAKNLDIMSHAIVHYVHEVFES